MLGNPQRYAYSEPLPISHRTMSQLCRLRRGKSFFSQNVTRTSLRLGATVKLQLTAESSLLDCALTRANCDRESTDQPQPTLTAKPQKPQSKQTSDKEMSTRLAT